MGLQDEIGAVFFRFRKTPKICLHRPFMEISHRFNDGKMNIIIYLVGEQKIDFINVAKKIPNLSSLFMWF